MSTCWCGPPRCACRRAAVTAAAAIAAAPRSPIRIGVGRTGSAPMKVTSPPAAAGSSQRPRISSRISAADPVPRSGTDGRAPVVSGQQRADLLQTLTGDVAVEDARVRGVVELEQDVVEADLGES